METVFPYPGGKSFLSDWIIEHFPEHNCYAEPFGGGASVIPNKEPSNSEVYNDKDGDLVHFFRVLRNKPNELAKWLEGRPYAKRLHDKYGHQYYNGYRPDDDIERAGRFFYLRYSQFASKYTGFSGFSSSAARNEATNYVNAVESLRKFANRFKTVQIENRDYRKIFDRYDRPDTLFYCDPPYVEEGDYLYTQDSFSQSEFVATVNDLDGYCIISYTDLPNGLGDWNIVESVETQHMSKGHSDDDKKRTERVERLVMNFDPAQTPMFYEANQATLGESIPSQPTTEAYND